MDVHSYEKDFNPLKHSVSGAASLTQNSQPLKYIPEFSKEYFTFIIFLQNAFTVLGIDLFSNSGRISALKNCNFLTPQGVNLNTYLQIIHLFAKVIKRLHFDETVLTLWNLPLNKQIVEILSLIVLTF